ncbi:hypothetical protein WJX75_003704 [Coccomyxa subellipsoidea]|uniref:UBA domain-containing protein n=1 Tax=Coccomyxa subellipsoidea TaxID=248742 RepID=A0ABR2YTM0_9CHLO
MATALEALKAVYKPKPENEDESGVGGDESVSEALSKEVFSTYVCRTIDRGIPHPGDIAEAASLSSIPLPSTSYPLFDSLREDIVNEGKLSQLQLEGVLYACTKHQELLPSGQRAGFFIGDGAGVGKGRQIAGIILDNYVRGRRRAVWLSTSTDLHHDATRDLRALGCHINIINNCQELDRETKVFGLSKDMQEGVLFMTYTTLIQQPAKGKNGKSRLQQVIEWVGGPDWDGCLIFDECHKAKNFTPGKEAQSTKVATEVQAIQNQLPKARVVYCSATGVSEVGNMAFMTRLGLWGPGSPFADFQAFLDSMKRRGVSFLEMLAMEIKSEGYYVARGLSFANAEFMELQCALTEAQEQEYDDSVKLWQDLRWDLSQALELTGVQNREVWKPFWATQQRFFKLLCISMKVPTVVPEAKKALTDGCAVVIGLQTTGEAAADALGLEPGQACGWVSTTREMLRRFVEAHFPVLRENAKSGKGSIQAPAGQPERQPVVQEAAQMKAALLQRVAALKLPPNFLDQLIESLGGPKKVAEMTGRRGRVVRDSRGHGTFKLRAKPDSSEMDSLNVKEAAAFMKGEKVVAIVSDAASTGISLHASAEAANQRRRVHFTCELPWSADKAIQQLGRSHRSNQVCAPIYKLVMTNLGGEQRFAAAVARRLQSLGALTRGDRRAASGVDLSESNFDSPLGRKSLRKMYDCIVVESPLLPNGVNLPEVLEGAAESEVKEILASMPEPGQRISAAALVAAVQTLHNRLRECVECMGVGINMQRNDSVAEEGGAAVQGTTVIKDLGDVRRLLNRLLGLPVARQNLLFTYFTCTLSAEIRAAKAEGRYFEGVSDLGGSHVSKVEPKTLWVDPYRGLRTLQHDLTLDRGLSFEAACRRLEHERKEGDRSGFMRSRHPMFGRNMTLLALQKPGAANYFSILRPNTGESFFDMEADELLMKYARISQEEAEEGWGDVYQASLSACMHGPYCQQGADCQVGRRLTKVCMLSGSIVRVWGALESVLARYEGVLSKSDRTMRVVRVDFGDATSLIGVRYPPQLLPEVVATLSSAQAAVAALPGAPGGAPSPATAKSEVVDVAAGVAELGSSTLQAAAMGAARAVRTEPVTPVDPRSAAKAFRAPKTVLDFFKPKTAAELADGTGHGGMFGALKAKRKSEDALSEIHVNRGGTRGKQQKRIGGGLKGGPMRTKPIMLEDSDCIELLSEGTMSRGAVASPAADEAVTSAVDSKPRLGSADANGTTSGTWSESSGEDDRPSAGGSTKQQGGPSKEALAHLTAMGFTEVQAKNALHATSNSLERAANWLLFGLRS